MSTFKYYRNNRHRYNTYESYIEIIEEKSLYETSRNILFVIALILSLLITTLVSFDTYKKQQDKDSQTLLHNGIQDKTKITKQEITQAVSNAIIQKIDTNSSFENINNRQLKHIVKNVIDKVENSPNHILYTQK